MKNKINDLFCLAKQHKQKLKMVTLPVIVGVAILFFWFNGSTKPIEIESADALSDGDENQEEFISEDNIFVDISGEVNIPGVYEVQVGTRLFQVIEMAGGLTEEANIDSLNRAEEVYDGEKIIVGNDENSEENIINNSSGVASNGKVNINTASIDELITLPNIGPAKAQNIIDYREDNGKFKKIEDIQKVNGIGSKTYDTLSNLICV